jgi:hypothetical protein
MTLGILSDPTICPDVTVFCDGAKETLRRLGEHAFRTASLPLHSATSSGAE